MVQLDFQRREITVKLVYYGPALSGKTTNLQKLHAHAAPTSRGRLMTLDTQDDRTLFFDLLPLHFRANGGVSLKVKLFTVPGQVMHNSTRKVVLKGADGVAFIADSQLSEAAANDESFANLQANLRENGADPDSIPLVLQFNKRDLDGIRTDGEIAQLASRGRPAVYKASAIRGEGVLPTFFGLARITWEHLDGKYDFTGKFGIGREDFLSQLGLLFGKKL